MISWSLEKRPIKSLTSYPKNARSITKQQDAQLQSSIEKFGLADKPIINQDGTVIGGHQRLRILKRMGHKEVECWVPNKPLEDKQMEELNIRLNKNTGIWDWECLANEWDIMDLLEYGFREEELDGVFKEEGESDEEQKPKKKKKKLAHCPACGHEFEA